MAEVSVGGRAEVDRTDGGLGARQRDLEVVDPETRVSFAGLRARMARSAMKRVTVKVPDGLLREAEAVTGKGNTETLIEGLANRVSVVVADTQRDKRLTPPNATIAQCAIECGGALRRRLDDATPV